MYLLLSVVLPPSAIGLPDISFIGRVSGDIGNAVNPETGELQD